MRSYLRTLGLRIPSLHRLVAQRDQLLAENAQFRAETAVGDQASSERYIGALCGVVNPNHYLDREWLALHHDLERYSVDKHCFQNRGGEIYRKGWEWTHCLYGLRRLGMLNRDHRALGVGCGREGVIYYLADHVGHVTATDLYGEGAWGTQGGREASITMREESKKHCPATVDLSRITFENQDGTKLTYADGSFDFAWSLSSIEHFGGHAAARQAMAEMARVVRPGGVVAVATEMLMLEEYSHPEYFKPSEIMTDIVQSCLNLEIAGPINFHTLPFEYLVDSIALPQGVHRRRRHVVLNDGQVQWTSILLFFRVTG